MKFHLPCELFFSPLNDNKLLEYINQISLPTGVFFLKNNNLKPDLPISHQYF